MAAYVFYLDKIKSIILYNFYKVKMTKHFINIKWHCLDRVQYKLATFQNLLFLVMKNTKNVLNIFVCFVYKIQTAYGQKNITFLNF